MLNFLPLPDNAARQVIDSVTVFNEHQRAAEQARPYVGAMYWKREGAHDYLVKTRPGRRTQERLGARTPQLEVVMQDYNQRKTSLEARLASLRAALLEAQRMNKALKAGRTPSVVIALLQALHDAGLSQHFRVVGTHALYAYETAASVRIVPSALATQDVDLLWDARKRVQFETDLQRLDTSLLAVLQKADATFERKAGQLETAINAKGFEVDFLRRQIVDDDPHPYRFTADEGDLFPVQAERAAVLTSAPSFEHIVIAATGTMALMRTVAPATFVLFKRWLSSEAPQREPAKRRRDLLQATVVQQLLDEQLLGQALSASPPATPRQ
jgi:hypothetical protein